MYYKWINKVGEALVNQNYRYYIDQLHQVDDMFNYSAACTGNAFYVCTADNVHLWSGCGTHLFEICLPEETIIVHMEDKLKVNQLIVVREVPWSEIFAFNILTFKYMPNKIKTEEICLAAVQQNWNAIKYVPSDLKTEELCLEAVRQNAWALVYVPDYSKTEEMCREAMRQYSWLLSCVPDICCTKDVYIEAVRQDGRVLKLVPDYLKTEELCLEAVRQDDRALDYVPEYLKSKEEICTGAMHRKIMRLSSSLAKVQAQEDKRYYILKTTKKEAPAQEGNIPIRQYDRRWKHTDNAFYVYAEGSPFINRWKAMGHELYEVVLPPGTYTIDLGKWIKVDKYRII